MRGKGWAEIFRSVREGRGVFLWSLLLGCGLYAGEVFAQGEPVGKIIGISGSIEFLAGTAEPVAEAKPGEVRPVSFERWERVKFHQPVYASDKFRTGRKSRLRILLSDKSLIALGPNSKVEVKSYLYNSQEKLRQGVIGVAHGLSLYIINKSQTHKKSSFKIITPTANIAARGTQGYVSSAPKVTLVANKEGEVDAGTRLDDCELLKKADPETLAKTTKLVGAGMGTKIHKCKPPTKPQRLSADDFNRILDVIIGIPGITTASTAGGKPLIEVQTGEAAPADFTEEAAPASFTEELVAQVEGLAELFEEAPTELFQEINDPFEPVDGGCTTQ